MPTFSLPVIALRAETDAEAGGDVTPETAVDSCEGEVAVLTNMPLRIGAIFIIFAGSLLGALTPVLLARATRMHVPKMTFFIFKYVGTGVIISTAWMHLLSPAVEALHDPCLEPRLGEYDWAFAIGLMTVMAMFLVELLAARIGEKAMGRTAGRTSAKNPVSIDSSGRGSDKEAVDASASPGGPGQGALAEPCPHRNPGQGDAEDGSGCLTGPDGTRIPGLPDDVSYPPGGADHLGHQRHHDGDESIAGQLTAIFILEFGVVFHSIFIGLALARSPDLVVLLIVLLFHQTLEGLGLGSRLAAAPWPQRKRWVPYLLGVVYGLSTPLAITAGLAAKPDNHETELLVQGIFDALSAGVLMYTGMVELLAHEFMFNPHMRNSPLKVQLFAFGCVAFGAGIMAVLANWA